MRQWRHYVHGSKYSVQVLTDHKNLQYFQSSRLLNQRQIRWSEFLTGFNLIITYRPAVEGVAADALSRSHKKSHSPVFKSIIPPMLSLLTVSALDSLIPGIHIAQRQDPTCLQILSDLSKFPSCSQKDGILYYCDRLLVPDVSSRQAILFACHDSLFAGHMG